MSTYAEKLRDPRWRCRRDQVVDRCGGVCEECRETKPLDVHHVIYLKGREPWDYPDELLMPLCRGCHLDRQEHEDAAKIAFVQLLRRLSTWQVYELGKTLHRIASDQGKIDGLAVAVRFNPEEDEA